MVAGPQHHQFKLDPEVSAQRDFTPEEIDALWPPSDMVIINRYHLRAAADITRLLAEPVPLIIAHGNPDGALALRRNTAEYDDDTDDVIAADPIIQELRQQQTEHGRGPAIRTRRTVVAFLFAHGMEIVPAEE
ncbi:MAG: hypothetical protein ACRD4B_09720, partial [Acidobacteriota bacterium]